MRREFTAKQKLLKAGKCYNITRSRLWIPRTPVLSNTPTLFPIDWPHSLIMSPSAKEDDNSAFAPAQLIKIHVFSIAYKSFFWLRKILLIMSKCLGLLSNLENPLNCEISNYFKVFCAMTNCNYSLDWWQVNHESRMSFRSSISLC